MKKKILNNAIVMTGAVQMIIIALSTLFNNFLDEYNINGSVIIAGCCILSSLTMLIIFMHYKASQNSNPNTLVRSVLTTTMLKIVIIAGSIAMYLFLAKENRSIGAIGIVMFFYIVCLIIEVWATSQMNKIKDGNS